MKTKVFLLIPYDVPVTEIADYRDLLLEQHRCDPDHPSGGGHFDYLVGALGEPLNDTIAEGRLPLNVRRGLSGRICEHANLPADATAAAIVTPDGKWHDLSDFGWSMVNEPSEKNEAAHRQWIARFRELIALHANCWIIEVWAHS